jgi:hypothetical protein
LWFQRLKLLFSLYNNAYTGGGGDFTTVDLNSLFGNVNWPDLETIMLYGVHLSPSVASRFFATHLSLRSISIVEATGNSLFIKSDNFNFTEPETPDRLPFPPNVLPNLNVIRAPPYLTQSILTSPTKFPRPITQLPTQLTNESLRHLQRLPLLKQVTVERTTPEGLATLAKIQPNITTLGASPVSASQGNVVFLGRWLCRHIAHEQTTQAYDVGVPEFINALSHFRHLEFLDYSDLISESDSPEKIILVLRQIVARCDRLRYLSLHCSSQLGVVCEMSRHENGHTDWVISALDSWGSFIMK